MDQTGTNLTLESVVPGGNQPLNIQCVICGDHQPQQVDFRLHQLQEQRQSSTTLIFFSTNVSGGGNPGLDTVGIGL